MSLTTARKEAYKNKRQEAERFQQNLGLLNRLTSSGVSYFNFYLYNFRTIHGCFGQKDKEAMHPEHWVAYVSRGETTDKDRKIIIPQAVFYDFEKRMKHPPSLTPLLFPLLGEHLVEEPWNLFFITKDVPAPISGEGWTMHSSLYVLSGKDNLKRFFDTCKKIMKSEPEFIERKKGAERGVYQVKERNPWKDKVDSSKLAEEMPWPRTDKLNRGLDGSLGPLPFPDEGQLYEAVCSFRKQVNFQLQNNLK